MKISMKCVSRASCADPAWLFSSLLPWKHMRIGDLTVVSLSAVTMWLSLVLDIFQINPSCCTTNTMCSVGSADTDRWLGLHHWETFLPTSGVWCVPSYLSGLGASLWPVSKVMQPPDTHGSFQGSVLDRFSDEFNSETDQYHHTFQSLWVWSQQCAPSGFQHSGLTITA